MKGSITIVACGGLANRLRAILSTRALAIDLGVEWSVVWPLNWECRCRPDELFLENKDIKIQAVATLRHALSFETPRKRNLYISRLFQSRYAYRANIIDEVDTRAIADALDTGDVLLWSGITYYPFSEQWYAEFFRPTAAVERIVAHKCAHWRKRMIGVHIRRTDNAVAIAQSPLEAFIATMQTYIDRDSSVGFYLATDDEATRNTLRAQFGDRIYASPAKATRNTSTGIIEAWSEILALSRCERLLGSYWSSFSELAATLGHIRLEVVTPENVHG